MDAEKSSESAIFPPSIDASNDPKVYWFPHAFDLKESLLRNDDNVRTAIEAFVVANPIDGAQEDDVFLIAHAGPVLMGLMRRMGDDAVIIPAETTVNWVTLGADHRLSDIWTRWQNGAPLSQSEIKAVVDACDRSESRGLARALEPLADYTEIDEVTQALHDYSAHESAVVTLRTARARAVAQERDTVTIQDVVLGLLSSNQTDPVSLALRNLADTAALTALDAAGWSTDVTPVAGCNVDHAVRDLLGSAQMNDRVSARNATILAALLIYGFDDSFGTLGALFGASLDARSLATAVIAQRERLMAEGNTSDLKQIDYFEEAMSGLSDDIDSKVSSGFQSAVPLEALFPASDRPTSQTILVAATRIDTPSGEDKLGIEDEAAAFARLIAFRKTRLPLSIGIFGHWGSGKTFFLNTVKRKIGELQGDDYHQNVVTIEFNAWHYMESNIWASLVSVIFKGLLDAQKDDKKKASTVKMLDALAVVQDGQIDAMEALINRYRAADAAQDDYVQAFDAAQSHGPKSLQLAYTIFSEVKKEREADFERLETALADQERFRSVGEIKSRRAQLAGIDRDKNVFALLDAAGEMITSGRLMRTQLRRVFWSPKLLLPMTAALIAAPFGFAYLSEYMGRYAYLTSDFAPVIATLTGGGGIAAIWVRQITAATQVAFERVKEDVLAHKDLQAYQAARAAEVLNVEAARQRLEKRTQEADTARHELLAETLLGRLSQLIHARAEGDTYTKHLSIIATIRADFENLSTLLTQTDERADEAKKWQTIRDNALVRLEKLSKDADDLIGKDKSRAAREARLDTEAIARDRKLIAAPYLPMARAGDAVELTHYGKLAEAMLKDAKAKINDYTPANTIERVVLIIDDLDRCPPDKVYDVLQAMHLFLSFPLFAAMVGVDTRWMETSLKRQLGDLVNGKNGATPRDYLEKIFQIPYWSKALQATQAEAFVGKLLHDIDDRIVPPARQASIDPPQGDAGAKAPMPATPPMGDDPVAPPERKTPATTPKISVFAGPSKDEAAFLTEVSGFAGTTPRRVIRFLNIFLLIKTLPYGQGDLAHQRAIITQLALCVGMPECAGAYFDELDDATKGETLGAFAKRLQNRLSKDDVQGDLLAQVQKLLEIYAPPREVAALARLRDTADIARKFTFAAPEAIEVESNSADRSA